MMRTVQPSAQVSFRQLTTQTGLTVLTIAVFLLSAGRSLSAYLNHDTAWFVYAIGRMLAGDRLYVDIMETNPPLFFWLMTPPVALGRWLGVDTTLSLKLWVLLLTVISTVLVTRLAALFLSQTEARLAGLAAMVALALYPAWDFAQREHIALVLALPYVVLQAARRRNSPVPLHLSLTAGTLAALGFGLKPHLLAVPLVLEIYVQWSRWRPRLALRAENIALAAGLALYGLLALLLVPAYFDRLLPLALATYKAGHAFSLKDFVIAFTYGNPRFNILGIVLGGVILHLARRCRLKDGTRAIITALLAAAAGFEISWLLQGTVWVYLAYPPMALTIAAALVLLGARHLSGALLPADTRAPMTALNGDRLLHLGLIATTAMLLLVSQYVTYSYDRILRPYLASGQFTPDIRRFYVFSTRMVEGFPFVNIMRLEWGSRYPYLWPLPAIVKARRSGRITPRLEQAERTLIKDIVEDLERHRPDLLLFSRREDQLFLGAFDYKAYFSKDPAFRRLMDQYREVFRDGLYIYYRRKQPAGNDGKTTSDSR